MIRLDLLLVKKGLVNSREKAKQLIKNNKVLVNGVITSKPSKKVSDNSEVRLLEKFLFVSRAGYKLLKAIKEFRINVRNKTCLDIGSSTGGFVDCLLKEGAKIVYAVDIAVNQLDKSLINNERVINLEGVDIRNGLAIKKKFDFCSIDVTFISSIEVLKKIKNNLKKNADVIVLIKPPYEASNHNNKLKINNKKTLNNIIKKIINELKKDYYYKGVINSPITGKKAGQKEFLMHLISKDAQCL